MNILINGEKKEIAEKINLAEMLDRFSLPSQRVAVELNRQVIRRKDWDQTDISEGDVIEVIHFVGGG